ncbi:MAG: cyclic nucleotide-binding domain-containing protein [Nitriliruptoraceae bacterium]
MEAGQSVFLAGHPAERLYVVESGAVKLTGRTPEANEVLLDVLGQARSWGPCRRSGVRPTPRTRGR